MEIKSLLYYCLQRERVYFLERFQGKNFILFYWLDRRIICEGNVYLLRQ